MAKIKNRIELNKTNKRLCGELDILCEDYRELKQKLDAVQYDFDIVKENIKSKLNEDAEYFTTKYSIMISITPAKTEFKYDMKRILEKYPEIKENKLFGDFKEKAEIKALKNIDELKK